MRKKNKNTMTEEVEPNLADPDTPVPCLIPAPAVINGGTFVGCQLEKNHEGNHQVTIVWIPG